MFSIKAYHNQSENIKIGKTLTAVAEYQGSLKEDCSVLKPSIILQISSFPTFNYVYIPTFNRYYFVVGITSIKNGLWQIDCTVDVLETYATQIKANTALLDRQENLYNLYLPDPELPVPSKTFTVTKKIGQEFETSGLYLAAQGKTTASS